MKFVECGDYGSEKGLLNFGKLVLGVTVRVRTPAVYQ